MALGRFGGPFFMSEIVLATLVLVTTAPREICFSLVYSVLSAHNAAYAGIWWGVIPLTV